MVWKPPTSWGSRAAECLAVGFWAQPSLQDVMGRQILVMRGVSEALRVGVTVLSAVRVPLSTGHLRSHTSFSELPQRGKCPHCPISLAVCHPDEAKQKTFCI